MLVTWRCTVCSLTTSRSAICRLVRPSARARAPRARAASGPRAASGADGGREARRARRRAAAASCRRPRGARARRGAASSIRARAASYGAPPRSKRVDGVLEQHAGRARARRRAALSAPPARSAHAQRRRRRRRSRPTSRSSSTAAAPRSSSPVRAYARASMTRAPGRGPSAGRGQLAQRALGQLGGVLASPAVERQRPAELGPPGAARTRRASCSASPVAALPAPQLREPDQRARRPRGRERVEVRRPRPRASPRPAPRPRHRCDRAVLGAAEREHVAAPVALARTRRSGRTTRTRARSRAPPVHAETRKQHVHAPEIGTSPRPASAVARRLVEAAHARRATSRARHQRRALEREPEHLEVRARRTAGPSSAARRRAPRPAVSPPACAM